MGLDISKFLINIGLDKKQKNKETNKKEVNNATSIPNSLLHAGDSIFGSIGFAPEVSTNSLNGGQKNELTQQGLETLYGSLFDEDGKVIKDNVEEMQKVLALNEINDNKISDENPTGENIDDSNEIASVLLELLDNEEFINSLDATSDGNIDFNKFNAFMSEISKYDDDYTNISLTDIKNYIKDNGLESEELEEQLKSIENNDFQFADVTEELKNLQQEETKEEEQKQEVKEEPKQEIQKAQASTSTPQAINTRSRGSSGNRVANSYNNNSAPVKKTLDNMSESELKQELTKTQNEITTKQEKLNKLYSGEDETLKNLSKIKEDKFKEYNKALDKVDTKMADELSEFKTKIDTKNKKINTKSSEISAKEIKIANLENSFNNLESQIGITKNSVDALNSISTSDMSDEKKSKLADKKTRLKHQLSDLKAQKEKVENDKKIQNNKLKKLKEEKTELIEGKNGLNALKNDLADLESKIVKAHPEIKKFQEAYKQAEEDYKKHQTNEIAKAKEDIKTSQDYKNKVNDAITNLKNRKTVREASSSDFGENVISFAEKLVGQRPSGDTVPWCANFVKYVLEQTGEMENTPDWYKNIGNKAYCPNIYSAAQSANAVIDVKDSKTGDLILFDWKDGTNRMQHVGMVISVENGIVTTVEGNTDGGQVAIKQHKLNDNSYIKKMVACSMS